MGAIGKKIDLRERDSFDMADVEDDGFGGLGDGMFSSPEVQVEKSDVEESDEFDGGNKKTLKTVTPRQKAVNVILRRAGKDKPLDIRQIMTGKWGTEVKIKDIAIFIGDEQTDDLMSEIAKECPIRNRVNLSAEVSKKRVVDVGSEIMDAGRMYQPISVARILEDKRLECTSGRHRLVFLAMVYGANTKIPVYIEEMTLNQARDAVVVSNQSRGTKALESAEHTVLQAVRGNLAASQDDMYSRTVLSKSKAKKYCVFSVVNRDYPMKLGFKVSKDSSRKEGGITTLANVENYWGAALEWKSGMPRKEFDGQFKESIRFLNAVVASMQKKQEFNPKSHLAAMTLAAMGKYFHVHTVAGKNPFSAAESVGKAIVGMGDVGRQRSEKTYQALMKSEGLIQKYETPVIDAVVEILGKNKKSMSGKELFEEAKKMGRYAAKCSDPYTSFVSILGKHMTQGEKRIKRVGTGVWSLVA